jgi:hypothetical protein
MDLDLDSNTDAFTDAFIDGFSSLEPRRGRD